MARLEGRTAIVTGGAMGIGKHYSQALAAEGAQVMIADIQDGAARRRGDRRQVRPQLHRQHEVRRQRRGAVQGAGGEDDGAVRQDRHPGQQRRALCAARAGLGHRHRRRSLGQGDGGQHARPVPDDQARRAAHDRQEVRQDHQHRLGHGGARHSRLLALRHLEGRGDRVHPRVSRELGEHGICVNTLAPGLHHQRRRRTTEHVEQSRAARSRAAPSSASRCPRTWSARWSICASKDSDFLTGQVLAVDGGANNTACSIGWAMKAGSQAPTHGEYRVCGEPRRSA